MNNIEFEVKSRSESRIAKVINAQTLDHKWDMSLYLDKETKEVLYPVRIESSTMTTNLVVSIILESDDISSCMLPPSVTIDMISSLVNCLETCHEIVMAARQLINMEQSEEKQEAGHAAYQE